MMTVKNRVRQIGRPASKLFRKIDLLYLGQFRNRNRLIISKKVQQILKIRFGNCFIETDPDGAVIKKPEIDQVFLRLFEYLIPTLAELYTDRIKPRIATDL